MTNYHYEPSSSGPTGGYSSYSAAISKWAWKWGRRRLTSIDKSQQDHRADDVEDHDSTVSDIEIVAAQGDNQLARQDKSAATFASYCGTMLTPSRFQSV
jgi:hypothetical protein